MSSDGPNNEWRVPLSSGHRRQSLRFLNKLLQRRAAQRPNMSLKRHRCATCHRLRRLGSRGSPSYEADDAYSQQGLWHCRPCWETWYRQHKQWYLRDLEPHQCSTCQRHDSPGWWGKQDWHCVACWSDYLVPEETYSVVDANHFDFVEIGTSNYQTLTQACACHPDGDRHAWNYLPADRAPQSFRGLAIDMERSCLDALPDLPNVTKVCAPVTECSGKQWKLHIPDKVITHWENVFATCGNEDGWYAMSLARACSSLARPRILKRELAKVGLGRLLRRRHVRAYSLPELLEKHRVRSIGVLKLDCEGHDCAILDGLLHSCAHRPKWFPQWIIYESNGMNDFVFGIGTEKRMRGTLKQLNYKIVYNSGWDTVAHFQGEKKKQAGVCHQLKISNCRSTI